MSTVSVIIVSYNTCDLLKSCLKNLYALEEADEIIVVDNASSDVSPQLIRERFPDVRLIELPENRGLTVASNIGLREAQGDFLLYLGSDAYPKANVIHGLRHYMQENADVGIVTAKLVLRNGDLDMDAHRGFPTPWASFTHFSGLNKIFRASKLFNQYFLGYLPMEEAHEIDLCISHFMFVRKGIFDDIKGWDEDFFLYGEDVDLCYRTKEAGYKIMYLPQFEVTHYKGASIGIRSQTDDITKASTETKLLAAQQSTRAMMLFYTKHMAKHYPGFFNFFMESMIRLLGVLRVRSIRSSVRQAPPPTS